MTDYRTRIFETMPVKKAVLMQIVPAVFGQIVTLIYSLADTFFVGLLCDPRQSAAVTVVNPPFVLLTAASNLFGTGGAAVIAAALGNKDRENAGRAATVAIWFGALGGLLMSALFALFSRPVLGLCGATPDIMPFARDYAVWAVCVGGTFGVLCPVLASVLRAEGRAVIAAAGIAFGGLLNIFLDPFFILPQFLGFGVAGAGAATAVSNAAATALLVVAIVARKSLSSFRPQNLRFTKKFLPSIAKAGFPSALQYALTVVAIAALSHFVSAYGAEAVAALGIVKKLDHLPLYFSIGVSTGLLPLMAYNHSAKNTDRLERSFRFGCAVSLCFSLICLVAYEIFAGGLSALFIGDEMTVSYAAAFLRRNVTAMPMMSVCYPLIVRFQATGKVKQSVVCSLLRKGALDIPLLFVADALVPLYGCMWVQPVVDSVSLVVAVVFAELNKKNDNKS